jgi:hypothetical protein
VIIFCWWSYSCFCLLVLFESLRVSWIVLLVPLVFCFVLVPCVYFPIIYIYYIWQLKQIKIYIWYDWMFLYIQIDSIDRYINMVFTFFFGANLSELTCNCSEDRKRKIKHIYGYNLLITYVSVAFIFNGYLYII